MKNLECSNLSNRTSDKDRTFFLKLFLLVFFFLLVLASKLSSQSLESQLKVIFGSLLQDSKSEEARILGKALSISGSMQSNMEMINAQNKQELTINLPPNTSLGQNNQVLPSQGYQWANPSNPNDYRVMPLSGGSYATLPPYDINSFAERWAMYNYTTLNFIFTYSWYADLNGDNLSELSEFNGIKRTFRKGEKIEMVCGFSAVSYNSSNVFKVFNPEKHICALNFIIQLFNAADGKLIVKKNVESTTSANRFLVHPETLGNVLPVGKYLIAVSMNSPKELQYRAVTALKEYFEVIE